MKRYSILTLSGIAVLLLSVFIIVNQVGNQTYRKSEAVDTHSVRYYGVDNASTSDFDLLKNYGVNTVQVIVQESDLNKLNQYIAKAEETNMHLVVWPLGPHFCGANCIPWNYSGGQWSVDSAVQPIMNRLSDWYKNGQGADLLIGVNVFQEPHNDGITIAQQVALAQKLKSDYGIPIANWIDNVVDTGVKTNSEWQSVGGQAIDWPITWTHCVPYYQGGGSNSCQALTCELANTSNPSCCTNQWASSCSQKCYGPEGTCAYGLDKMTRDRTVIGDQANYGVLLQAFEMSSYNNAHVPTAAQMYEEACRVAKSGVVDMILWYDWSKTYGGYSGDLKSQRYDSQGGDRWEAMKRIYDECIAAGGNYNIADINRDGKVNLLDYVILFENFGVTGNNSADLNTDNLVNILDYVILFENFGKTGLANY